MQPSNPLVSIVMPAFNSEKFIGEAIQSIISQTYSNFELIIVNDGSEDNTGKIIENFDDNRIKHIELDKNVGISNALNMGLKKTSGEFIARMDADDISLPRRIERQVNYMKNNPDTDIVGTWIRDFGAVNRLVKKPTKNEEIKAELLFTCPLAHPTVMARRKVFKKYKYDEKYPALEDYNLWFQLALNDYKMENVPEVHLKYRRHSENITITEQQTYKIRMEKFYRNNFRKLGLPASEDEIKLHVRYYGSFQMNPQEIEDLYKWYKKILAFNLTKKYCEQVKLEISVEKRLDKLFYLIADHNPNLLFSFWKKRKKIKFKELYYLLAIFKDRLLNLY